MNTARWAGTAYGALETNPYGLFVVPMSKNCVAARAPLWHCWQLMALFDI